MILLNSMRLAGSQFSFFACADIALRAGSIVVELGAEPVIQQSVDIPITRY